MKNIEEITNIVNNISDRELEIISEAELDYWEFNSRTSNKGYRRLKYHLAKYGLTLDEYFAWRNL